MNLYNKKCGCSAGYTYDKKRCSYCCSICGKFETIQACMPDQNFESNKMTKENEPEFQAPGHPPQVELVPGALTTAGPDFHLIPLVALERLAERFMLGEVRKGSKAWNALSSNQHILTEKKFILARLSHIIHHTYKLMNKIANNLPLTDDDDAGAIAWGGVFAICASDALTKQKQAHEQDDIADARKQIAEFEMNNDVDVLAVLIPPKPGVPF